VEPNNTLTIPLTSFSSQKGIPCINRFRYMALTQLASGRSPFDVQPQMGHTTLTMTNRYASLNVKQLQQSHDLYSPLRAKDTGSDRESSGTGYWDVE
jgi:integrase/recombinase XerD